MMMNNWFPGAVFTGSGILAVYVAGIYSGAPMNLILALTVGGITAAALAAACLRLWASRRYPGHAPDNTIRDEQGDILHAGYR
ncbi:MAG: hypothetical protein ABFD64_08715 [Armatimonadota bacterium]